MKRCTSWTTETADGEINVGLYPSLALDGTDHPHISYARSYGYPRSDLKYAWFDGSMWHATAVDRGGGSGRYISLALDDLGRPRISSYDLANQDLKYTWFDGSEWHVETVDSVGSVGEYTSLILDTRDHPHISYADQTNGALKHAWYDGSIWHTEVVDPIYPNFTSIALDHNGRLHISYGGGGSLRYAWFDGATWRIEVSDNNGHVGRYSSLALDSANRPHISYYDVTNGDLKYAWRTIPAPTNRVYLPVVLR